MPKLRIVPFDPATELDKLAAFEAAYENAMKAPPVGPWTGRLNNAGEFLALSMPDEPPTDEPTFFPQILSDRVNYDDETHLAI